MHKSEKEKPLINREYLLQKFDGKGGWTYAAIPEIAQNKNNPFGWVKVRGFIDDFELKQYKLMPMGNRQLLLPVRAEIRKKIGKQVGDYVHVCLYPDENQLQIPEEIIECFRYEPKESWETFRSFTEGGQKAYLDWIYNAKTEETKAKRIVQMLDRLERKLKFYDNEPT